MTASNTPFDDGSRPKSVVILAGAWLNWLWVALARRFQGDLDSQVHFVCGTEMDENWYRSQDETGSITTIVNVDWILKEYGHSPCGADDATEARDLERRYGVFLVDSLQADRRLGLGYASCGSRYPFGEDRASYEESLRMFVRVVRFWERYLEQRDPDLVIGGVGTMESKILLAMCRARGIRCRCLAWGRYQDYWYWSPDEYWSFPELPGIFQGLTEEQYEEPDYAKVRPYEKKMRQILIHDRSFLETIRKMTRVVLVRFYRTMRYGRPLGTRSLARGLAWWWRDYRLITTLPRKTATAKDLKGRQYILYPMEVEPESQMGVMSPEFNDQLSLIFLLAKNLPAGVSLAVKEHIHYLASRPKGFFDHLNQLPNVITVSPLENAVELARDSLATVVISGTLACEAASLGVPVISLNKRAFYNFLPHVHLVTDFLQLRAMVREVLSWQGEGQRQRRVRDGRRYIGAIKKACIDLSHVDFAPLWKRGPASDAEIESFWWSLMGSLKKNSDRQAEGPI